MINTTMGNLLEYHHDNDVKRQERYRLEDRKLAAEREEERRVL